MGFALLVLPPDQLIRPDGTKIASFKKKGLAKSVKETLTLLRDWRILMMLPCFFTPEVFFPFQASMNAYAFNLRTRTLNSLLNNLIQIPTTLFVGYILSNEKFGSRRKRALIAITFDAVWITGAYVAQTAWLASWKFNRSVPGPSIDCSDQSYIGAVVIYMLYAAQYGMFQNLVLWILGTLSNDPAKSGAMAGLFVGLLSAGTAVSFGVDATAPPYENENAAWFSMATLCWPILTYIAWTCVKDTNYLEEDSVVVPIHMRKKLEVPGLEVTNSAEIIEPKDEHEKAQDV